MSTFVKLESKKIQKLRKQRCWSQDELACASDLSIRTVQRVEKSGNASLETTKALASALEVSPSYFQSDEDIQSVTFSYIFKYGWLLFFLTSSLVFGAWIIDILIPTLKGANFDNQYEIHGNFRYLDLGGTLFFAGFIWLGVYLFVEHKRLHAAKRSTAE